MTRSTLIFLLIGISLSSSSFAQDVNNTIAKLLSANKPFELKTKYEQHKNELAPILNYMSQALLANSYNQPEAGIAALDTLLNTLEYQKELGIDNRANLIYLQTKFYSDIFDFENATSTLKRFLNGSSTDLTPLTLKKLKTSLSYYETMASFPKTELIKPDKSCEIFCYLKHNESLRQEHNKKDSVFSLVINCHVNGKKSHMIFDSGNPSFNLVSEKFAKQHGIKNSGRYVEIINNENKTQKAWIGTADTMLLGDIIYINPVFHVVESLFSPEVASDTTSHIHAILGSNILFRLGEFQYFPSQNKIIFPKKESATPGFAPNMIMNSNRLQYIKARFNNKTMLAHFNLGATSSKLNLNENNQNHLKEIKTQNSSHLKNSEEVTKQKTYQIPNFQFLPNNKDTSIQNIIIRTQSLEFNSDLEILGLDFFSDCKRLIVNYNKMFIIIQK